MQKVFFDRAFGFADFPNDFAVTLYFTGCNLSCPYCYNQGVVTGYPRLSLEDIDKELTAIDKRMGGNKVSVVLSGGEPTACISTFQKVADHFLAAGRRLALHTNGMNSFRDMFASVVLSVKTSHDGVRDVTSYRQRLADTMIFGCKNAAYKELRIVDAPGARDERNSTYQYLVDKRATNGWRVVNIEPQPTGGDHA